MNTRRQEGDKKLCTINNFSPAQELFILQCEYILAPTKIIKQTDTVKLSKSFRIRPPLSSGVKEGGHEGSPHMVLFDLLKTSNAIFKNINLS